MGWLKDLWNNFVDWLMDKVIRPVVKWITKVIDDLVTSFRIWKHAQMKALAEVLKDNTQAFLFLLWAIGMAIVGAVLIPQITALLGKTAIALFLKKVKEKMGKYTKMIIDLQLLSKLLEVAWPEYRELTGKLEMAVSSLMEELKLTTGFISGWYSTLGGLMITTSSLLGMSGKAGYTDYMGQAALYTKRLDDRFARYARDPELIVRDFVEEVLIPASDTLTEAQKASLQESLDRIEAVENGIKLWETWKQQVSDLIDTLPAEIADSINKHWKPIKDDLDAFTKNFKEVFTPALDAWKGAIELNLERKTADLASLEKQIEDPYWIMAGYERYPREKQENFQEYLARITGAQMDRDLAAAEFGLREAAKALAASREADFYAALPVVSPEPIALSWELPIQETGGLAPSWNQGEY